MDFSTIIASSTITNSKNFENSISNLTLNTTSDTKIKLENVDSNLVNYLNKEFNELGFESIYSSLNDSTNNNIDYNLLFKNAIELVKRFSRQQATLDRVQEDCYKLDRENELFLKRQQSLKDSNEVSNREKAEFEEKLRQSQSKNAVLNKNIKDLNEENRKLQTTIETRDKQYKHERKKLEKEIEKLKERVQLLSTGKTKELPHIDMNQSIRKSTGSRATWNTDNSVSKKQIDLYSELIKDYDRKNKELMTEIFDLKNFISSIYSAIPSNYENPIKHDEQADQEQENPNESIESIIELPFENIHSRLNHKFQSKFKLINNVLNNISNREQSIEDVNNFTSISTILSEDDHSTYKPISKKNSNSNVQNELNSTFTIDVSSSSDEDQQKSSNNSKLNKKISNLKAELNEYRKIIDTQSKFIDSFTNLKNLPVMNLEKLSSSSSVSLSSSSTSSSENENQNLSVKVPAKKKENNNNKSSFQTDIKNDSMLDEEKRIFYEQKLKLEQDNVKMRKTWDDLTKKQKALQEEQDSFYQAKVFSSFFDTSSNSNSKAQIK